MKIKSIYLAIIIFAVIFVTITATSLTGLWKTTTDKIPIKYADGEFAGQYNPADIRGSYTFDDIHNTFEIPLEDLGKAFGLKDPALFASFKCNELETIYASLSEKGKEVGTTSVRYFVALYTGLPYDVEEGTWLLKPAVGVLKAKAKLSDEQLQYLDTHSVDPVEASVQTVSTSEQTTDVTVVKTVTGSTTFQQLLDWGVKIEDVDKLLNDSISDLGETIKNYATRKGIEFSTIKVPFQTLVDSVK